MVEATDFGYQKWVVPKVAHHLLQATGMVGVAMGEQDPFEVVLGPLPVTADPFEIALDEREGSALALIVIAVDETEATIADIVSRLDEDRIAPPDIDDRHRQVSHRLSTSA